LIKKRLDLKRKGKVLEARYRVKQKRLEEELEKMSKKMASQVQQAQQVQQGEVQELDINIDMGKIYEGM